MDSKFYVTWQDVKEYIEGVSDYLEKTGKKDKCPGIFTFPRGGLILATVLSYHIDLPLLTNPVDGCIIIDDIVDTGITMKKYSEDKNNHNYFITSMFIKDTQLQKRASYQCEVDYYKFIKTNEWIVYPWEEIDKW